MNNKVLVTGGCGFIGSHVVKRLLELGYKVLIVDNLSSGNLKNISNLNVDIIECDILDSSFKTVFAEYNPDYVVHLASQGSVRESLSNMVLDAEINIKGSLEVIQLAKAFRVKKVIFSSSAAVYGEPRYLPIDEEHEVNPLSPYGLSKLTVERYLQLASSLFGINYSILRFGNVYGINQRADNEGGVVSIFIDEILKGSMPFIYGNGTQTRDFINVKDVSEAIAKTLINGCNQIINVSSNKSVSIREILEIVLRITRTSGPLKYRNKRRGDINHSLLKNKKAIKLLNWKPKIDLETGLKEVIEYQRKIVNSKGRFQEQNYYSKFLVE